MVNSSSLSSSSDSSEEEQEEEKPAEEVAKSPPVPKEDESEYEYETSEGDAETPAPPGMGSVTGSKTTVRKEAKKTIREKSEPKAVKPKASEGVSPERASGSGVKAAQDKGSESEEKDGGKGSGLPRRKDSEARKFQETKIHLEAQVPERIRKALEEASTFEEYKGRRTFTYLHLFSGRKDRIAETLAKRCREAGLRISIESLDKDRDHEVDFTSEATYQGIGSSIDSGEWDGFHSYIPSETFDRRRHDKLDKELPPVRSGECIYGYPSNTKEMQEEADIGTTMAAQTTWLYERQVQCQKRRKLPEVATLQSPPGTVESGSVWDLPEVKAVMKTSMASMVEYNTCQFQTKQKERNFTP